MRNPFRTGDWIQIGEYQGIVQNLNMRTTILLTLDGNHIQIPNSLVFKSVVTNFSTNPSRRGEFCIGIEYSDSIVFAQELIIGTLHAHPAVLDEPEPIAIVDKLGPSTVKINVQFWFDGKSYSVFKLRSALMRQVKRSLEDGGISMPTAVQELTFPQGVPLHRDRAKTGAPRANPVAAPATDRAETATASTGEGDLASEEAGLKSQAMASDLLEAEENLLTSRVSADRS